MILSRTGLVLAVACTCLLAPVSACGMGGIGSASSGALLALCVVLLPVIIPVGGGYLAYKGISKGVRTVKKIPANMRRKRNSDIIKTQMSRAKKIIGKDAFNQHIQKLFDTMQAEKTAISYFDLGVALFLNQDLLKADEYMSQAITIGKQDPDFYRIAHAYFVRGLINQYLWEFTQAAEDFKEAIKLFEANPTEVPDGADDTGIPHLTAQDARNSYGFALQLHALYDLPCEENVDNGRILELLNEAIASYDVALDRVEVKQGMWFHNRGVARYFRTYYLLNDQIIEDELKLALQDFDSAINSKNFGTAADGYAMAAQTLTRLGKPEDEVAIYVDQALEADPKVFLVDMEDEGELSTPWPLPRHEFTFKKAYHEFEKVWFHKPTWCDHCMGMIKNPVTKQGYQCKKCEYRVHSKCFPQVKGKKLL